MIPPRASNAPPVDLVEPRVERDADPRVPELAPAAFGDRPERRHADDADVETERDALRHRRGDPDAGEAARPAPERDAVERPAREARLGEQSVDHRQHELRVAARLDAVIDADANAVASDVERVVTHGERDGAGVGRRLDREQIHGDGSAAFPPGDPSADASDDEDEGGIGSGRAPDAGASRKNRSTSATSRVIGIGGRLRMNVSP